MKDKKDNKMDEIRKSLPEGIVASGIFTDNDLRVLHVLARMQESGYSEFYKEHGYFHISNEKLREETGIADNHSLGRSLDRLIEYGLISRTRGKRGKQSEYVYHAEAANNFTMEKQDKKSKKKGAHSEKRTNTETQAVTVQSEKGAHSDEKSAPILKINDLHEIIAKAVEKGCTPLTKQIEAGCATLVKKIEELNANLLKMSMGAHSETKGALFEADGALLEGEKRGRTIGDEPNSLKMREGQRFDGENEANSLKMSMGAHSETKGAHSEKCTTDIDIYNNILYHDDHVSGYDKGPGDPGSPYEEEKKKKIEKRNKEEIERLRRSIAFCDEAIAEALAAGNGDRYRELLHERTELASQRDELGPEDEYATKSDAEIEKMVQDQLNNGGNLTDLHQPSINRYMQTPSAPSRTTSSASSTAEPSQLTTSPPRRKPHSQPSLSSPPSPSGSGKRNASHSPTSTKSSIRRKSEKTPLRALQSPKMNRRSPRPPKRSQEQFLSA